MALTHWDELAETFELCLDQLLNVALHRKWGSLQVRQFLKGFLSTWAFRAINPSLQRHVDNESPCL